MLNRLATRLKRVASRAAGIAMLGVMLSTPAMAHVMGPDVGGRLIVISSRIVKTMGFDWFDQLEHAPDF